LFLNFIPALVNVYYIHLSFCILLTVYPYLTLKKYTGTSKFQFRAQLASKNSVEISTVNGIYKTLARPVLSYGSEAWTIRRTDERKLISAEMRFLRRTAGYTRWDHKRN
jgi:hypothetical protein